MPSKNVFVEELTKFLKPLKFKKKSTSWYFTNPETIHVINLQKSQWGDQFYLNVGILARALDKSPAPPEYKFHIRCRIGDFSNDGEYWEKVGLNLGDESATAEEKARGLMEALRKKVLPYFESMKTLEQMKDQFSDKGKVKFFNRIAVSGDLRRYLGFLM